MTQAAEPPDVRTNVIGGIRQQDEMPLIVVHKSARAAHNVRANRDPGELAAPGVHLAKRAGLSSISRFPKAGRYSETWATGEVVYAGGQPFQKGCSEREGGRSRGM
jgi:hypothetical protein